MAAFSLWQLLNQHQSLPGDDPSDPTQQQQSAGQAIGQSLNDFWDRAQDDDLLDHLVERPGSPDDASLLQPMPMPFYPGNSSKDDLLPPLQLLASTSAPLGSNAFQSGDDGSGESSSARNLQTAQAGPLAKAAFDAFVKYGIPSIGAYWWSQNHQNQPQTSSPPPAMPGSSNSWPDQPPSGVDDGPAADATAAVPAPSASSASPAAGRTIGDFTVGSESPFEDSDFLPQFEPSTSDEERDFRGDFSKGRHDPFVDFQIDSLRKAGCIVEPHVPLGVMHDPRTAIADWMHKCFYNVLPVVGEGKTGLSPKLRRDQPFVFEQVGAGNGTSWSPKVRSFGLIPGTQFPPLPLMRSWSAWHGAPIQTDYPFGGAP
jgi:hypothetical protein